MTALSHHPCSGSAPVPEAVDVPVSGRSCALGCPGTGHPESSPMATQKPTLAFLLEGSGASYEVSGERMDRSQLGLERRMNIVERKS